jgi:hypothetical protein
LHVTCITYVIHRGHIYTHVLRGVALIQCDPSSHLHSEIYKGGWDDDDLFKKRSRRFGTPHPDRPQGKKNPPKKNCTVKHRHACHAGLQSVIFAYVIKSPTQLTSTGQKWVGMGRGWGYLHPRHLFSVGDGAGPIPVQLKHPRNKTLN